ncbi:tRNA (adenine(58)-N(1))-methyltransferase non-catalytic subunit trm6 [Puccinia graminis f. sp. tritici]|uniref:tRNA (adenine(58)-N(1))-methyltransferase non-catalytic subunit TRM6 n=1 Tax=Puccinia graminis f. sp. tritici TaxID=56615 RepID=A0A5B0RN50_PUCGR|nr:tRNA (adenine(58)-N(1))-methyltransferase non-catalytic subunit trm6 [Puccinia graminis f. sp. tritici]
MTRTISAGDNLLLKLPSGQTRTIKNLTADSSVSLGKFGKFQTNELINQPFGLTFEILEDGKLVLYDQSILAVEPNTTIDEMKSFESIKGMANGISNVEDIEATNELIKESDGAQKLTNQEIEELKKSGLSGREIILRQIQQHSAFELKSEFSKAKYIKRKEKKYAVDLINHEPITIID